MAEDGLKNLNQKLRWYSKLEPVIKELEKLPESEQYNVLAEILMFSQKRVPAVETEESLVLNIKSPFKIDFGTDFRLIEVGPKSFKIKSLILKKYLLDDEDEIPGTELCKRADALGGFAGQATGEDILEIQQYIRPDLRDKYFIPLPATRYEHLETGDIYIPCLERNTSIGQWRMGLRNVSSKFSRTGRLIEVKDDHKGG